MSATDPSASFEFEGFLVAGDDRSVAIALPPYVIEIDRDGLEVLAELPPLPGQDTEVGVGVRVRVAVGTGIRAIGTLPALSKSLWPQRRPFAMRTRGPTPMRTDGSYEALEHEFLLAHGIEVGT